jgi:hypothetical protein
MSSPDAITVIAERNHNNINFTIDIETAINQAFDSNQTMLIHVFVTPFSQLIIQYSKTGN